MESTEQKQVQDLERTEQLELEQIDDDYREQLKQIELFEEEEEIRQKRHYDEIEIYLEQLEQEQQSEQSKQVLYYEWMQRFEHPQEKILPLKSTDLDKTSWQFGFFGKRNGIISSNEDDNSDENEQENVLMTLLHRIQEQQQEPKANTKNIPFFYRNTLYQTIQEYGPSLEIIIQEIDDESNEDDWISIHDNDIEQQTQQIDRIQVYRNYLIFSDENQTHSSFHISRGNINTIRSQLRKRDYLLLKVYNTHHYYVCHINEMKQKVSDYFSESETFLLIQNLHETDSDYVRNLLNTIMNQLKNVLDDLLQRHCITELQLQQMQMDPARVRLNFLSFQPDTRYEDVPFRAHMTCCLGPTMALSRFLFYLLQSIYEEVTKSMTFIEGIDAVDAVELYTKKGSLKSKTLFATFSIDNLSTIFAHQYTLQSLERFLNEYVSDRHIQGVTIETILELVTVFLANQYFVFENKVYRQMKGNSCCSSGPCLNTLLVNINMFYRQQNFVNILMEKKEIFGRCFDETFLTWNGSDYELYNLLKTMANNQSPRLRIRYSIGEKVNYLQATIAHEYGHINNRVNRETLVDPYSLIPLSNYPLNMVISTIRMALLRAIAYCSTKSSFNTEINYIESIIKWHNLSITSIIAQMEYKDRLLYYDTRQYADINQYNCDRHFARFILQKETASEIKQQQQQPIEPQTFFLNCPFKEQQLIHFKQDFECLLQYCYGRDINFKKLNIDTVSRPNYPANTR
ncbi:unnamed protein product [Rotaria sordida]|uniref:Reverse transcriptase domain-containing protein n=1 Tax=Rotaria sordida TaxID=392033 RepID=A0A816B6Q1_9BILA|nr:unnamed protein product [Rotaria sordida]CAF1604952.1 unnamed protein product [Rotaria sordida]